MRFIPHRLLNVGLAGTVLLTITGCGGTASVPTNTTASNAAASSASPAPSSSTGSPAASPASSSGGGSSPSPSQAPSSPAGTTISNIEQMSGWNSCDTCSGGGTIGYSMTQGLTYPQAGTTRFSIAQGTHGLMPYGGSVWEMIPTLRTSFSVSTSTWTIPARLLVSSTRPTSW